MLGGLREPAHHCTKLTADLLDRVLGLTTAVGVEHGAPGGVLKDPLTGEAAVLDTGEDLAHAGLHALVDHERSAAVITVLGRI